MTADQLIEQAKLAIRWAESVKAGTPIEVQNKLQVCEHSWTDDSNPVWCFDDYEYREKLKPRDGYVVLRESQELLTKDEAYRYADMMHGAKVVHMREVVE